MVTSKRATSICARTRLSQSCNKLVLSRQKNQERYCVKLDQCNEKIDCAHANTNTNTGFTHMLSECCVLGLELCGLMTHFVSRHTFRC